MRTGEAIREILRHCKLMNSFLIGNGPYKEGYINAELYKDSIHSPEFIDHLLFILQITYYDLLVIMQGTDYQRLKRLKQIRRKIKPRKYESVEIEK